MADGGRSNPYIYHITPVDNLPQIVAAGELLSDRLVRATRPHVNIGYSHIKERRLRTEVPCCRGKTVGDFVPFYFCRRSVMLYVIHRGNAELSYHGGQASIVHLVSSVGRARASGQPCVYTESNAGATGYIDFRADLDRLGDVLNWKAIEATDFRDRAVKDGKQAEFLVCDRFPFHCFGAVAVQNEEVGRRVEQVLAVLPTPPPVIVRPDWYY